MMKLTYPAAAGGTLNVEVELLNDGGDKMLVVVQQAPTVRDAVALAEDTLRTGRDDSWTMNETRPA